MFWIHAFDEMLQVRRVNETQLAHEFMLGVILSNALVTVHGVIMAVNCLPDTYHTGLFIIIYYAYVLVRIIKNIDTPPVEPKNEWYWQTLAKFLLLLGDEVKLLCGTLYAILEMCWHDGRKLVTSMWSRMCDIRKKVNCCANKPSRPSSRQPGLVRDKQTRKKKADCTPKRRRAKTPQKKRMEDKKEFTKPEPNVEIIEL